MRMLDERRLLAVWDLAAERHLIDRAVVVLSEAGEVAAADLPIGARDRRLLELRETLFGPRIETTAVCPACGQRFELAFTAAEALGPEGAAPALIEASCRGRTLRVRQPTSRDLAAVASEPAAVAPRRLIERLLVADEGGEPLSDEAVVEAGHALRAAAPDSEILLDTACSGCGAPGSLLFDPAAQVWSEVESAARRLLWEIHALALAYGWTEDEVVAIPPSRRRRYLELIGA